MKAQKNFPGLDGFVWWTGIVEDKKDPLKLGRVQVRMYGWHTDVKSDIPTEDLFWAQPVFGVNTYQTSHTPKEGEMVFGFYMDGEYAQFPFIVGVFPNIPEIQPPANKGFADPGEDVSQRPETYHSGQTRYPAQGELKKPTTSRLARNEDLGETPLSSNVYNAKYPYNCSLQSESGHYVDIDDTFQHERLCLLHRSGSYIEFCPNGSVNLVVARNFNIKVLRKMKVEVGIEMPQDLHVLVHGDIKQTADENINIKAGKKLRLKGGQVHLNSETGEGPEDTQNIPFPKIDKRREGED